MAKKPFTSMFKAVISGLEQVTSVTGVLLPVYNSRVRASQLGGVILLWLPLQKSTIMIFVRLVQAPRDRSRVCICLNPTKGMCADTFGGGCVHVKKVPTIGLDANSSRQFKYKYVAIYLVNAMPEK